MIKTVLLGATGNIGKQTLSILRYSCEYALIGVAIDSDIEGLEEELPYFPYVEYVAIANEKKAAEFINKHPFMKVYSGSDSSVRMIKELPESTTVINAISGNAGLLPTLTCMDKNFDILLANKESLVIGSSLMKKKMNDYRGRIYPIDSEHVGLYKCIAEAKKAHSIPDAYFITASGGALRDYPLDRLDSVTADDVLRHPTWKMSKKITIDCATMVNKGFEIIEASELFNIDIDRISALICRSSLIHAFIYAKNEMGEPIPIYEYSPCDMKCSIAFALSKGKIGLSIPRPDEIQKAEKEFNSLEGIDSKRYPLFELTVDMFKRFSNIGMIFYNAVDTCAIDEFLKGRISYLEIGKALFYLYDHFEPKEELSTNNLAQYLSESEKYASSLLNSKPWRNNE